MEKQLPNWFKEKGYLHISPSLKLREDGSSIIKKITNPKFIEKYAFYPLMHTFITERKYKKGNATKHTTTKRKHAHKEIVSGKTSSNTKIRPLHYASHFDSLVYGYYADILNTKYEAILKNNSALNESILAYRKIETFSNSGKGKANIHFAKECFDEITIRSQNQDVAVLAIDLKSFFSTLDHQYLKKVWCNLLEEDQLPNDHYNVFKSCTKFKYVLKDDLRIGKKSRSGRKKPFDESKLAKIRKSKGFRCFFESNEDFRLNLKEGKLPVYSNPFFREIENTDKSKFEKRKINVGIPQGLPISAVLANAYLLEFDTKMIEYINNKNNGFYRRYSDDILVICSKEIMNDIEQYAYDLIKLYKIKISEDKTERFIFKHSKFKANSSETRLTCFSIDYNREEKQSSLAYLGFEFKGYHVGIKNQNLSKYYRKLISSVKRKARRTIKIVENDPYAKKAVFKNQIKKIYNLPLKFTDFENIESAKIARKRYNLCLNENGFYEFRHYTPNTKNQSNYRSYIKRCCETFETDSFQRQIRKSKTIVHQAINKHLK